MTVTKSAPGQTARHGMWPFGTAQKITQQIRKVISSAAPSSRTVSIALISERPNGSRAVLESSAASIAGKKMLAAMKSKDDDQHHEGEALLLDPAAAFDVVDPAKGGVHRSPEGGADPERAEEGGDPDRRRVVLDPVEDVGQRALDRRWGRGGAGR